MKIVRRHEPDEERQIEALLLVLRGGASERSEASAAVEDGLTTGPAQDGPHATNSRKGGRHTGSTAA